MNRGRSQRSRLKAGSAEQMLQCCGATISGLQELQPPAHAQGSLSFFTFTSPARMVDISPCMNAQGTLEPTKGHFSPLGQ